jgi:hypothetical protein
MTWDTYRRRLLAANPALIDRDAKLTLTSASLLRQLEKSYRQAVADFVEDGQACQSDVPDFMKHLFGGFRG